MLVKKYVTKGIDIICDIYEANISNSTPEEKFKEIVPLIDILIENHIKGIVDEISSTDVKLVYIKFKNIPTTFNPKGESFGLMTFVRFGVSVESAGVSKFVEIDNRELNIMKGYASIIKRAQ